MQPIFFKNSLAVATMVVLHSIVPPLIAAGMLYIIAVSYGAAFDYTYVVLGSLTLAIGALLFSGRRDTPTAIRLTASSVLAEVVVKWSILIVLLLFIGYLTKSSAFYSRRVILTWILSTPAVLVLAGWILQLLMRRLLSSPQNSRRAVFAGFNEGSLSLATKFENTPGLGVQPLGFFDDRSADRLGMKGDVNLLGELKDLPAYAKQHRIDVLFVALPVRHLKRVMDLLDGLQDTTVSIYYVPDILVFDLIQARTDEIMGVPIIAMCETPFYGYRGVAKRVSDVFFSAVLLVLASPVMLVAALLIKLTSRGPALFKQRRYGLDGHEILVYKFRSMVVTEDGANVIQASANDDRVTAVGKFLRRYSIDELPQLINVLDGRMSLVGPRPHAVAHNEKYRKLIKGYMVRHKVLPGITGLAQVNGCRGETAQIEQMEERVRYDLEYLRNWSLWLDVRILFRTAIKIFSDRKAY